MRNFIYFILVIFSVFPIQAANVTFYTTASSWQTATGLFQTFDTTAANIEKANEVGLPSGNDVALGNTLTFGTANTGLQRSFNLRSLQSSSQFIFNDSTGVWQNAISVGAIDVHEDDDWEMNILSGPGLRSFAFELVNNDEGASDSYSVYGTGNVLLGSISGASIPTSVGDTTRFLGVISDVDIVRILYNDDTGGDDIGFRNLQFGTHIPEPNSLLLMGLILFGIFSIKRTAAIRHQD